MKCALYQAAAVGLYLTFFDDWPLRLSTHAAMLNMLPNICRAVLEQGDRQDRDPLGKLMDKNFDLRRQIFGDAALGQHNLMMIELARQHGGIQEAAEHRFTLFCKA